MVSATEPSALCTVIEPVVPSVGAEANVIVSGVSMHEFACPAVAPVTASAAAEAAVPPVSAPATRATTPITRNRADLTIIHYVRATPTSGTDRRADAAAAAAGSCSRAAAG